MLLLPIADEPNFSARRPWATWAVIAVNVAVFLLLRRQTSTEAGAFDFFATWGYVPLEPRLATFFTSMYLHGGFLHLAGNMLFLWIFGDNVEGRLGPLGFLGVYHAGGLAAVLVFHLLAPHGTVPLVGASGAIFATQGFYFLAFPSNRARFVFWFFVVSTFWLPARLVLGFFLVGDFVRMLIERASPVAHGGVAYAAHVGGFLFGFVFAFAARFVLPPAVPAGRSGNRRGVPTALLQHAARTLERGQTGAARATFAALLDHYPASPESATAAFHLGLLAMRFERDPDRAAAYFALAMQHPAATDSVRSAARDALASLRA